MLKLLRKFFTENIGLKMLALVLALALWFYVVGELKKGTEEEMRLLNKVLPSAGEINKDNNGKAGR